MRSRVLLFVLVPATLFLAARPSLGAPPAAAPKAASPAVILDTSGFWRMYHVLKPPVAALDEGLKPALTGIKWLDWETPRPAADWMTPGFDDSSWARLPLRRAAATPYHRPHPGEGPEALG